MLLLFITWLDPNMTLFFAEFKILKKVMPEQNLEDKLTIFYPGRTDYAHKLSLAPSKFLTFRHYWIETILSLIPQITFCTSMSLQMDPVLFWEGYLMQHYIETKPHKKCQTSVFHDLLPLFATVPWQAVLDDISPIYRKKNYHK